MNFPKRQCPLVIAFLSITIAAIESISIEPATNRLDPHFWKFVLREFVFKTISSPRYRDDDLYKKLLDAPFYGGPLAIASNDENAVVSRGNVYNMPDGQWILCQEGCTKCELCDWQRDDPAVKWTLRRVKRLTSLGLPKWDLRLTVVPQMDESFYISKHPRRYNVMNEDKAGAESAQEPVPSTTQQEFAFEKAQESNFWSPNGAERHSDSDGPNEKTHDDYRRGSRRIKRYRSKRRPPFIYYDPDKDVNGVKGPAERPQDDTSPRLIVGIDQHGKKHLIHLLPVDSPPTDFDRPNNYATSYRPSHKLGNAARISRTIHQERDAPSYENLIERILNSFNTHRNLIEDFLFPHRLESSNHNEAVVPLRSSFLGSGDETLEGRNLEGYRIDDSRQSNQYSSSTEYQAQEQDEQFRRMTQEVNKPYGEYQDQNTMNEYERYGVSAVDQQQQQQHQGERSLLLADGERKRRNSFAKLMDSSVGNQASSQNHTQPDPFGTEFSIKRDFLENSTDQALADLPLRVNETDARIRNLPEVSNTSEMRTLNSDD